MLEKKNIYRGREIKEYDYLMGLKDDLIKEFFELNPNYDSVKDWGGDHYTPGGWNLLLFKFTEEGLDKPDKAEARRQMFEEGYQEARKYPTVWNKLLQHYGDDCITASYAVLEPGAVIKRHTGAENREAYNLRIHIPLIVPTGDIGMEVYGEFVDWSDLFGFDNQKIHSVWNLTQEKRLIFIIDLKRTILDLPQGDHWTQASEDNAPRFPKTE
jgi:hypothetical protein